MIETPLAIDACRDDEGQVLLLCGELDLAGAPAFADAVLGVLSEEVGSLLLDISRLEFLDSTGLMAMLTARSVCAEHGCEFAVTEPGRQVQRLLQVTDTLDRLPVAPRRCDCAERAVRLWPAPSGAGQHAGAAEHRLSSWESSSELNL
jgi:anti-sigma B factor antagonist